MIDRCLESVAPMESSQHKLISGARSLAVSAFFAGTRCLGVNSLLRKLQAHKLVVVCYHGVVPDDLPEDPFRCRIAVTVSEFRAQLQSLLKTFNPVSPSDVLQWMDGGLALPPSPCLVTFDDGFRNTLTCAAPELLELGIPALVGVTTGYVGKDRVLWTQECDELILQWDAASLPMPQGMPGLPVPEDLDARAELATYVRAVCKSIPDGDRRAYLELLRSASLPYDADAFQELYEFLTWDEVRSLHDSGFAIGSHTVEHPILTRLTPDELDDELRQSKATIEREVGVECPWITYPNGGPADSSPEVIAAAAKAGYKVGFTLTGHTNLKTGDPLMLDRVCVSAGLSLNAFYARLSCVQDLARPFHAARE